MFNPANDLPNLFTDMGVLASFNGVNTLGHMDIISIDVLDQNGEGSISSTKKTFRIITGSLPGIKEQLNMSIGGVNYTVLKIQLENDGNETVFTVQGGS